LLKRLAFRFGQQEYREKDTKEAESSEHPEGHVIAECLFDIGAELGDEEGQEPADGNCYTGSLGLDARVEHLAHHRPRKRAPAHAVRSDKDDEWNHRQPRYLLYHVVRVLYFLQVKVQAQGNLQKKCPLTWRARDKSPRAKVKICMTTNSMLLNMFDVRKILIYVVTRIFATLNTQSIVLNYFLK